METENSQTEENVENLQTEQDVEHSASASTLNETSASKSESINRSPSKHRTSYHSPKVELKTPPRKLGATADSNFKEIQIEADLSEMHISQPKRKRRKSKHGDGST